MNIGEKEGKQKTFAMLQTRIIANMIITTARSSQPAARNMQSITFVIWRSWVVFGINLFALQTNVYTCD